MSPLDVHQHVYTFRGWRGRARWPMRDGIGLGVAGAWNFALRVGLRPSLAAAGRVAALDFTTPLFVCLDRVPENGIDRDAIRDRVTRGGWVVASGDAGAWRDLFPEILNGDLVRRADPRAALAYQLRGGVELVAPPRWPLLAPRPNADRIDSGEVMTVSGERQTPRRALLTPLGAAAVMRWRGLVFLNGAPFHALQAWLQGQEDLQPWLQWRHRLFWLDEWVASVKGILEDAGVPLKPAVSEPVAGLGATCVVLRHDVDYSRDTSYLQLENREGLAAVYAILRDANTSFWTRQLERHPTHEVALHYNTARYSRAMNFVRRTLGRPSRPQSSAPGEVTGRGLLRQVSWARSRGIGIATLHRHLAFLQYPEWVDGLDAVFESEPEVLGASSLFRGHVLRWGVDRADGGRGTYAEEPDPQFPFWLPFRLAHGAEGGRLLRGWESTSVMEIEPALFEQMLAHRVPGLPQRVFTLNFHPAHAQRATFAEGGNLAAFTRIVRIIRDAELRVLTLSAVYEAMNRFVSGPGEATA